MRTRSTAASVTARWALRGLAALSLIAAGCNARRVRPIEFGVIVFDDGSIVGLDDATVDGGRVDAPRDARVDDGAADDVGNDDAALEHDAVVRDDAGAVSDGCGTPTPPPGYPTLVSIGPGRVAANNHAAQPSVSADGQFVAFDSIATNLVTGDTNGVRDVFLRERTSAFTRRISVGPDDAEVNGRSYEARVSSEGRWVVFTSEATNFPSSPYSQGSGIYLYSNLRGRVQRIDAGALAQGAERGASNAFVSTEARFIAYQSDVAGLSSGDTNGALDVYLWERETLATRRISVGPAGRLARRGATLLALSADGGSVAMNAPAGDLSDPPDATHTVFVHDRVSAAARRVPGVEGTNGPVVGAVAASLSRDGRYLALLARESVEPDANGLSLLVYDREADRTVRLLRGVALRSMAPGAELSLSQDGSRVALSASALVGWEGCPRDVRGIVLFERATGRSSWLRLSPTDTGNDPASSVQLGGLTADGTQLVFMSTAPELSGATAPGIAQIYLTPVRF